jgi:hypothetical protein
VSDYLLALLHNDFSPSKCQNIISIQSNIEKFDCSEADVHLNNIQNLFPAPQSTVDVY